MSYAPYIHTNNPVAQYSEVIHFSTLHLFTAFYHVRIGSELYISLALFPPGVQVVSIDYGSILFLILRLLHHLIPWNKEVGSYISIQFPIRNDEFDYFVKEQTQIKLNTFSLLKLVNKLNHILKKMDLYLFEIIASVLDKVVKLWKYLNQSLFKNNIIQVLFLSRSELKK